MTKTQTEDRRPPGDPRRDCRSALHRTDKLYELKADGTLASVRIGKCRRVPVKPSTSWFCRYRADRAGNAGPVEGLPLSKSVSASLKMSRPGIEPETTRRNDDMTFASGTRRVVPTPC